MAAPESGDLLVNSIIIRAPKPIPLNLRACIAPRVKLPLALGIHELLSAAVLRITKRRPGAAVILLQSAKSRKSAESTAR